MHARNAIPAVPSLHRSIAAGTRARTSTVAAISASDIVRCRRWRVPAPDPESAARTTRVDLGDEEGRGPPRDRRGSIPPARHRRRRDSEAPAVGPVRGVRSSSRSRPVVSRPWVAREAEPGVEAIRGGQDEPRRDQGRDGDRDRHQGDDRDDARDEEHPEGDPEQAQPDRMGEDEQPGEPQTEPDRPRAPGRGSTRIGHAVQAKSQAATQAPARRASRRPSRAASRGRARSRRSTPSTTRTGERARRRARASATAFVRHASIASQNDTASPRAIRVVIRKMPGRRQGEERRAAGCPSGVTRERDDDRRSRPPTRRRWPGRAATSGSRGPRAPRGAAPPSDGATDGR